MSRNDILRERDGEDVGSQVRRLQAEIYRLETLLRSHGIDYRRGDKTWASDRATPPRLPI